MMPSLRRRGTAPAQPDSGNGMKQRHVALLVGAMTFLGACNVDKFVDVNTSPNAPQSVTANLYLPPLIHWMATSPQFDGR